MYVRSAVDTRRLNESIKCVDKCAEAGAAVGPMDDTGSR